MKFKEKSLLTEPEDEVVIEHIPSKPPRREELKTLVKQKPSI